MKLNEVIDVELWKDAQQKFADYVGLPTVTVDNEGNEIISSSRPPIFCQLVRSKIEEKCLGCRKHFVEKLQDTPDKIVVYRCHCGLLNILVPIIASGKQQAAVICGPIVEPGNHIHKCKRLAAETRFNSVLLIDALKQMRVVHRTKVERYATVLHMLSQIVPEVVREKYISDKKVSELNALQSISSVLNSTFKIEFILKSVIDFMKDFIESFGCSIVISSTEERFSSMESEEYMLNFENEMIKKVKESGKVSLIDDLGPEFEEIKSVIILPLYVRDEFVGSVNLYRNSDKKLSDETVQFLSIFSDQVAMAIQNAQQYEQIKQMAITDKLTNLYNRRHFMKVLEKEVKKSEENELSVALIDVDYFAHYNNNKGHLAGDYVLSTIASLIKSNVRSNDTVGRYGGEEFIVVFPNTNPGIAYEVMERVRLAVENEVFDGQDQQPNGNLTLSAGIYTSKGDKEVNDYIKKADEALYSSKNCGRNRVTIYSD